MTRPLRILLVEDSPLDAVLLEEQLTHISARDLVLERVGTTAAAMAALHGRPFDCVLLDLSLPDARGLEALAELHYASPEVPIVVLSAAGAEEMAVRAVSEGAQDYLVKGEASPALVVRSVRYAIERKETERELKAMALTDALTGLPNRTRLMDRIAHALDRMTRTQSAVALLFLDLDRFKLVNDSLGHTAGDRLLVAVADRLRHAVRPSDTIARFGGDEFIVLCEDLREPAEAEVVVGRIHQALSLPVELDGQDIVPTVSIGVAVADGPGDSPERLLRDADAAMYRAKSEGRGGTAHFAEEMRTGARERLALEAELHRALREGEFEVHYQPVVGLSGQDHRITGVEALVRWHHPERGLLPPDSFIRAAEETGLIRRLGAWVLQEACGQLAEWEVSGVACGSLTLSVNLSPHQLADDQIIRIVEETLTAYALSPGRLCLEITESVLLDAAAGAPDRLRALKAMGVRIAMDDFGTGYASLASLTAFPIDVLKIDRGFVRDMGTNEASRRIVAAVTGLAQGLGLDVVAEGVEQAGLAVDLRALGCDRAQGFAFAKPMPAADVARLLAAAPPPAAPSTELIRVFVCDDSDDLRVLLRATLEEDPAIRIVGEAGDGVDIIEGIRGAMADVVLMDLAMPRVDGLEAIRILRAWRADLGIIVLSGYEQERMRAQATALGADRYVEKRSPISQLRAAIHEVGESRRGPRPGRRYRARRSAA